MMLLKNCVQFCSQSVGLEKYV